MADNLTLEQRRKCMSRIRNKDTKMEVELRRRLWQKGYRYRKNYKVLSGKPDIVITKHKIAVFCDSEFFHGKDWDTDLLPTLQCSNNSEFWIKKISRNMERDQEVNRQLTELGWVVLRFWGKDIKKDPDACVQLIIESIALSIPERNENNGTNC